MAHSIEIPLIDNQSEKDEIEEGSKVDHLIDIKKTKKFVNPINEDLDNLCIKWCTMFKVNVWLRETNPDAYTPKMVSIGPYHMKNPQLINSMKKYKLLYLRRFLQRKEGLDVESCISELEKLKEKALNCYDDIEGIDDSDEFCKMLLLDGCFVVEFIRERCEMYPEEGGIINIYGNYIFRDLMLLENQLPFFVLKKLYRMTKQDDDDDEPLAKLVSERLLSFVDFPVHYEPFKNIKHLLHLVHKYSCQSIMEKNSNDGKTYHGNTNDDQMVMPNATELSEAGVSFAKASDGTSLFDIKFVNGLMTIPCFRVEDYTETFLRNLIAYEQQSCDVYPKYFSDYASFMDTLIESEKDVNLLRQEGIIENFLGEDKQVVSLLNKIGSGVAMIPQSFYYKEEFNKADKYSKKLWNRMMASLKHNYFSSFWVGTSTVAAIILLILTQSHLHKLF